MNKFKKASFWFIAVILALFLIIPFQAFAQTEGDEDCTTLFVGKAASPTGEVMMAHNEDDGGRMAMDQIYVPRMTHPPGSFVNGGNLEPGEALIPQLPLTYAYYWSNAITPGGASFADIAQNEYGVTVLSNSAANSNENCNTNANPTVCLFSGGTGSGVGIGYGLRTAIAQRATSARNGVEVAIGLLNTYGYASSGRMYTIADSKEVWSLQIVKGNHYVAQRLGDDEVGVVSNRYTIRQVDMNDGKSTGPHKKFYASDDLISYAISRGWYTCTDCVNYSDFDFGKVYESTSTWNSAANTLRQQHAYEILFGSDYSYPNTNAIPFSVIAPRKIGIDDLKMVERTHYEGTPDDLTNGYTIQPSSPHYTKDRVICTASTMESTIWQLRNDTLFNVMWRTTLRPEGPYVPWYPQTGVVPHGYSWLDPVTAQNTHFNPAVTDYQYDPSRAFWAFSDLQNLVDPMYGQVIEQGLNSRNKLEQVWTAEQPGIEEIARILKIFGPKNATKFLAAYADAAAGVAWDWAKDLSKNLAPVKIQILAPQISLSDPGTVSVAILSNRQFDATLVDPNSISMGLGYNNAGNWPKPLSVVFQDVNGDGKNDMVATFSIPTFVKSQRPYANVQDLFLQGEWMSSKENAITALGDGKLFVAEAVTNIVP